MRKGYWVLATVIALIAIIPAATGDSHWWIPMLVAAAILLLGLDQRRHERRMDRMYQERFGRPYERHRGVF